MPRYTHKKHQQMILLAHHQTTAMEVIRQVLLRVLGLCSNSTLPDQPLQHVVTILSRHLLLNSQAPYTSIYSHFNTMSNTN